MFTMRRQLRRASRRLARRQRDGERAPLLIEAASRVCVGDGVRQRHAQLIDPLGGELDRTLAHADVQLGRGGHARHEYA